ncbi:hypothetical protein OEZ86_014419 [Tetradesmus obliquus]|nr:hypothetical protein OEZ86_014419 [Tetradesmus obliquus]
MDTRETLLAVVLDSLSEEQISEANLFRLQLVCSFKKRQSSADAAAGLLSGVINQQPGGDAVTGLLLVYPACLLVCLEGYLHTLQGVLQELSSSQDAAGLLQDTRLLLSSEGLPSRCCSALFTAFIPSTSSVETADAADPAQVVKLASSAVATQRRIASSLSVLPEAEALHQLGSLESYHDDLPGCEVLLSLASSAELPSASDWLGMYGSTAPALLLDDDVAWPVARPVVMSVVSIHISSCGDSRAVIINKAAAIQPVEDHTPTRADEQARIRAAGGQVFYHNGCRVMGALAMSRAIGDHALRPYGVIADPDVAHYARQPGDEFLLLASDGLWAVLSNQDAADLKRRMVTTESPGMGNVASLSAPAKLQRGQDGTGAAVRVAVQQRWVAAAAAAASRLALKVKA